MKKGLQILRNKTDFSIELIPKDAYYSLIWLHGLGDSSEGFLDFFQLPQSPAHHGAKVKLLQAPLRPVSINGGMKFNSWYDIRSFNWMAEDKDLYSVEQIQESKKIIHKHVQEEFKFWQQKYQQKTKEEIYKRIYVGGFSQGCAMSLLYALTCDNLLGGVIGYSGHVFRSFDLKNKDKLSMFMYHGQNDHVINWESAKKGYDLMIGDVPNFQLKLIPFLQHTVFVQQLQDTTQWIKNKNIQNKVQP